MRLSWTERWSKTIDLMICPFVKTRKEIRRQFKSSDNPTRLFALTDLVTTKTKSRIDDLMRSFKRASANPVTEYRLCATWLTATDSELTKLLEPAIVATSKVETV